MNTLERDIKEAQLLVGAIQERDVRTSEYLWELADLTSERTYEGKGRRAVGNGEELPISAWADEIGWLNLGNSVETLRRMRDEARAWKPEERAEAFTLWQHHEARKAHKGNVTAARKWLLQHSPKQNITKRARTVSEITGVGPVYEATMELIEARRAILRVPSKLAGSGILGNEPNFDRFRRELERVKNAVLYLDRYLADETVVDSAALDDALGRILAGEGTP